jgi:hypothetical protein
VRDAVHCGDSEDPVGGAGIEFEFDSPQDGGGMEMQQLA